MTTLSACLVVHQEEATIADCIESFRDLVDEIVVLHDGPCTDRTLEIASRYTDRLFTHPVRAGGASPIRPFAIARCTGDWVLVLDADERLSPELRRALRDLIERPDVDAYGFDWEYVSPSGAKAGRRARGKRFLFRREQMYVVGLPHMTPQSYGRCERLSLSVHHLLPERSVRGHFRSLLGKNRRRARVAAGLLAQGIDRISTFNADLYDPRVMHARKLRWLIERPLTALLTLPIYGFGYWYLGQGYWRNGWIGLRDSWELPSYYGWFALHMLRHRWRGEVTSYQPNG